MGERVRDLRTLVKASTACSHIPTAENIPAISCKTRKNLSQKQNFSKNDTSHYTMHCQTFKSHPTLRIYWPSTRRDFLAVCWPFFPIHYNLPACSNTPPAEPGFFLARNKWLRSATSAGQRSNHQLRSRPAQGVGHHLNEAQFSKIIRVGFCIKWRLSYYLRLRLHELRAVSCEQRS